MRLAYFSPLNPIECGISDYSEELLPRLAPYADIDLFVDGYRPTNPVLASFPVYDARGFARRATYYDAILFHMGNSPAHAYIYPIVLRFPGVVVLHDLVLHHLISWLSWDRGDARTYLNEFRYCYGPEGEALARRIIQGQAHVSFFDYPLSDHMIKTARGLIVHNEYIRNGVLRVRPDAPVRLVRHGVPLPESLQSRRHAARARLGIAADALVIGSFGHISPFKRIDTTLRAFRRLLQSQPQALCIMVGSVSPNYDVEGLVRMLDLGPHVRLTGYVDWGTFQDYIAATDICINLRYPSAGETSGAVLRLMAAGLPVLVSRTAAFAEFPDGTCIKVDVDESEEDLVTEYLRLLASDTGLRRRLGENARRYVAEAHTMEGEAQGYLDALREWYPGKVPDQPLRPPPVSGPATGSAARPMTRQSVSLLKPALPRHKQGVAVDPLVMDTLTDAAAELGLDADGAGLQEAARAVVELGLVEPKGNA